MKEENIYLTSKSNSTNLTAIFEDNGTSSWLYLLESENIIAGAWVYNRINPSSKDDLDRF